MCLFSTVKIYKTAQQKQNKSRHCFIALRSELGKNFPVLLSNVLSSKYQGRLIACNSKGILLPPQPTPEEFASLKNSVPDSIVVKYSEENLNTLGNCIGIIVIEDVNLE